MPEHDLISLLRENRTSFSPVLPFDPAKEKLVALDFTESNRQLTDEVLNNITLFGSYIDRQLAQNKARYGIGGYAEHRTIYSRSRLFDGIGPGEEPRRFHLGIDIWGQPGTPVMAPLDGRVHSFACNGRPGDYGATIILGHSLEGIAFYTLYGHLSLASVKGLNEGDRIGKGQLVGEFGLPAENGQWPPHLHFQVIQDMQGNKGDYPGVCKFSERVYYLANYPDPDLILQMNRYTGR
jgi:peptidoglycan LD-endopeptidase LytH